MMQMMCFNFKFVLSAIALNPKHYTTTNLDSNHYTTPPLIRGAGGDRRSIENEIIANLDVLEGMLRV
jgi:hypothetical protein